MPRLKVPEGAIGIGGKQTGIYPLESPGGWNIIGNTPVRLFDKNQDPPCFAVSGDHVQFQSITLEEYMEIKHNNNYAPEYVEI